MIIHHIAFISATFFLFFKKEKTKENEISSEKEFLQEN
jgi:hypothetical protein